MITSEAFYEHFQVAGMLKAVAWTPSWGGTTVLADVDYRAPSNDVFGGDQNAVDYTIRYPAIRLPGLKRGEVVTVQLEAGATDFRVREDPESRGDGSEVETKLTKV